MVKIAHFADTHIRNLKYHKEYRQVFEEMYESLRKEKVDYIVHCGDIAHTKTQISPEYVEMCREFLSNLADIAPTHVILGNHDGNLKNSFRMDAVSPIAAALKHDNLFVYRDYEEIILPENISLSVLSVFDRDAWKVPASNDTVNICLFHGSVSGCRTDLGWQMEHGDIDIAEFAPYDYAMLGDIHKTNQILDMEGRVRYAGSTVQQNFGETNDKGYLLWNIKGKDDFTCKHMAFSNPKPFVTLSLTARGKVPARTNIPEGARLRVQSKTRLPIDVMRKALDVARARFKPESIVFNDASRGSYQDDDRNIFAEDENMRDIAVQEKFISKFLEDYNPDEVTLKKVFELNKKFNTIVEENEDISRNVRWKLDSFEWKNYFNYGKDNKISFDQLSGVVGIFGKNFSGKSSIFDSFIYTLYNSTSKSSRKNINVVNQNKDVAQGTINLTVGHNKYKIKRRTEKYTKRLHGKESKEARVILDFSKQDLASGEEQSLNGITRNQTDKAIRKSFGSVDDFLLTSYASQMGSLAFVEEGNTKRKEILAKFLDLELFDMKYRHAKDEAKELLGYLKTMENVDYDTEIEQCKSSLLDVKQQISEQDKKCKSLTKKKEKTTKQITEIRNEIESVPESLMNISNVLGVLKEKKDDLFCLEKEISNLETDKESSLGLIASLEQKTGGVDAFEMRRKISRAEELKSDITALQHQLEKVLEEQENASDTMQCPECGAELDHKSEFDRQIETFQELIANKAKKQKACEAEKAIKIMKEYDKDAKKLKKLQESVADYSEDIAKQELRSKELMEHINKLEEDVEIYEKNKKMVDSLNSLKSREKGAIIMSERFDVLIEECQDTLISLHKQMGSQEERIVMLTEQKDKLADSRKQFSAYDLFMKCMSTNGISYNIIKNKLPIINEEVSKVLANVVDFEVFFENDENKLDIYIKHPTYEPRPIDNCSGAEKTLASMAIRLALLNVSSLPKGDIFIMDEPGTALDEENMEGFIRIIDMVKSQFKTVFLISHLDSLKDCVDMTLDISKENGYAKVRC